MEHKAECHVEESSRKKDRRRTTFGRKSEASMFGIKKPLERKANHFLSFGCFVRPGNQELDQNYVSRSTGNLRDTGAKTQQRILKNNWADVCGFLKPPDSDRYWKVRMQGAFSIQPIKAAIMRHGSTWNSSIGAVLNHIMKNMTDEFYSRSVLRHHGQQNRRSSEVMSAHSLSS